MRLLARGELMMITNFSGPMLQLQLLMVFKLRIQNNNKVTGTLKIFRSL